MLGGALFVFFWLTQVPAVPSFFTRIFIWRFAPYLLLLSYLIIARDCLRPDTARAAGWLLAAWLVLALALVKHGTVYEVAALTLAGLLFIGVRWLSGRQYSPALETGLLSLLLIAVLYLDGGIVRHRYKIIPQRVDIAGRSALTDWLRDQTPSASLFLVPPDLEGVQTAARRAIVANYKNVTVGRGAEAREWKQRMERIAHCPPLEQIGIAGYALADTLTGYYLRATPDQVRAVMEDYQADYFITYRSHRRVGDFAAVGFTLCYADKKMLAFKRPGPTGLPAAWSSTAGASTATAPDTAGYTPR